MGVMNRIAGLSEGHGWHCDDALIFITKMNGWFYASNDVIRIKQFQLKGIA